MTKLTIILLLLLCLCGCDIKTEDDNLCLKCGSELDEAIIGRGVNIDSETILVYCTNIECDYIGYQQKAGKP